MFIMEENSKWTKRRKHTEHNHEPHVTHDHHFNKIMNTKLKY